MDLVALALQCFWPRVYLSEIKIVAVTLFNLYFSDIPRPFFFILNLPNQFVFRYITFSYITKSCHIKYHSTNMTPNSAT